MNEPNKAYDEETHTKVVSDMRLTTDKYNRMQATAKIDSANVITDIFMHNLGVHKAEFEKSEGGGYLEATKAPSMPLDEFIFRNAYNSAVRGSQLDLDEMLNQHMDAIERPPGHPINSHPNKEMDKFTQSLFHRATQRFLHHFCQIMYQDATQSEIDEILKSTLVSGKRCDTSVAVLLDFSEVNVKNAYDTTSFMITIVDGRQVRPDMVMEHFMDAVREDTRDNKLETEQSYIQLVPYSEDLKSTGGSKAWSQYSAPYEGSTSDIMIYSLPDEFLDGIEDPVVYLNTASDFRVTQKDINTSPNMQNNLLTKLALIHNMAADVNFDNDITMYTYGTLSLVGLLDYRLTEDELRIPVIRDVISYFVGSYLDDLQHISSHLISKNTITILFGPMPHDSLATVPNNPLSSLPHVNTNRYGHVGFMYTELMDMIDSFGVTDQTTRKYMIDYYLAVRKEQFTGNDFQEDDEKIMVFERAIIATIVGLRFRNMRILEKEYQDLILAREALEFVHKKAHVDYNIYTKFLNLLESQYKVICSTLNNLSHMTTEQKEQIQKLASSKRLTDEQKGDLQKIVSTKK